MRSTPNETIIRIGIKYLLTLHSLPSADPEKKGETIDVGKEESKLREIRSELGSGQIAGTFLASLQNKQVSMVYTFIE